MIAVTTLGIAFVLLTWSTRKTEPEYQGRPLRHWVRNLDYTHRGPANDSEQAIGEIGTNALPFLLKWIAYEPHPSKIGQVIASTLAGSRTARKIGPVRRWVYPDPQQFALAEMAPHAFEVLGSHAAPAVPALARLLGPSNEPGLAPRVISALEKIGPSSVPALTGALTNGNAQARFWAATALASMGTNARPAVPALILCLKDKAVASAAFLALGSLRLEPDLVVPALTNLAQDPDPAIRLYVVVALIDFGQNARSAVPSLQNALLDPDLKVRDAATNALRVLAPELLPGPTGR